MMTDPAALARAQIDLFNDSLRVWQTTAERLMGHGAGTEEPLQDKRFKHPDWTESVVFNFVKESYLIWAKAVLAAVRGVKGLDPATARKVDFYTRQFVDALSPSNFVATNPEVLAATLETGGQIFCAELENLLEDLQRGKGRLSITMTDMEAFRLGGTILAYAVISGSAIVSGDPIGERAEFADLLLEFKRVALSRAWRVALVNASEELLPVYHTVGLKSWYIGDEAIVRPAAFSLEGRAIRKVRQSVSRVEKSGFRERVLAVAEITRPSGPRSRRSRWSGGTGSRARLLDGDGHALRLPRQRGRDRRGRVGPDRRLHPPRALAGERRLLALDDAPARRRPERPDGVPHRPGARLGEGARCARGVAQLRDLRPDPAGGRRSPRRRRALRFALIKLDRFFQVERLHSFNRKFFPEWRPRYVCFERYSDLPLLAVAYGHVEGFVVLPAPWAKTTDLTAA